MNRSVAAKQVKLVRIYRQCCHPTFWSNDKP